MTTAQTTASLKSMIDTANATAHAAINDPRCASTQWTGETFLRLYSDACRDIQAQAIRSRSAYRRISGPELNVLASIPGRLIMSLCRLIPEATPAICNAVPNKDCAAIMLESMQRVTNESALLPLQVAHSIMQDADEHYLELQRWSGQGGILVCCLVAVACAVDHIAQVSVSLTPQANPQALMVAREMNMHLDALKSTLSHCATV